MDTLLRDLRFAVRTFRAQPGIALTAVVTLALGIGATTAVFTVVDAVLLRPLPYRAPDRLVVALHGAAADGPLSPADYFDYRREAQSFERLEAAQAWSATLAGGERPERVPALRVSAGLFDLLGVPPAVGRTFADGEDRLGRDHVVVLSDGLWQRRFGGDSSVLGRTIQLNGEPYVVAGVMPPSFRFAPFWQTRAELWTPLSLDHRLGDRDGRSLRVFGRLKDGVSVEQAQAEMTALTARLGRTYPETNTGLTLTVRPLLDKVVSGIRGTLAALMAMVGFVLLIACANVANSLLARASGRQREMAVRTALGASRARLVRQLLTESLLLAAVGAGAGLALAVWSVQWLLALLPPGSLPRQYEVTFDARIYAAAALATVAAGLGAGLAPALQIFRTGIASAGGAASKSTTEARSRKRLRAILVAAEMAAALVLLAGAGLMGRTMTKLNAVQTGFRIDHVAAAEVSLAGTPHEAIGARHAIFARLRDHLAAIPGVRSVSAINHLPLAGDVWRLGYWLDGEPQPPPGRDWSAVYRIVQPGYFRTMGLALLGGRDFTPADDAGAPPVAIISRAMAERRWPGRSPIGRRIYVPGPSDLQAPITVVGIVADARQSGWTAPPGDEVYLPHAQRADEFGAGTMTIVLATDLDPERLAATLPREVALFDPGVTVSGPTTMARVAADELWRERLTARLTALFAAVALGLAGIGLSAVVAHAVARRTREFGVRVALGATRADIRRLALREGLGPAEAGLVAGLVSAAGLARTIEALLFGVAPLDPVALGGAAAVLLSVAFLATWLPARRASRMDPVAALRTD